MKHNIERKIDALKTALDEYLKTFQVDKNLIKANSDLLREKEDLEERVEILLKRENSLRRELKKATDQIAKLKERLSEAEAELQAYKRNASLLLQTYKQNASLLQELKSSLEKFNVNPSDRGERSEG
jgi:chromosome segregation ATPase